MSRDLNEILVSGEVDNIVVAGNIGYLAFQDADNDGKFMRVTGGVTTLYRAPDQDVHWVDTNTNNLAVGTVPIVANTVTVDQDVFTTDGSVVISGKLDNNRNQSRTVTISVYDDGVAIASGSIDMLSNETGKIFAFSGDLENDLANGSVVTVEFETTSNGDVQLRGDIMATKLEITKAKAAPVL